MWFNTATFFFEKQVDQTLCKFHSCPVRFQFENNYAYISDKQKIILDLKDDM